MSEGKSSISQKSTYEEMGEFWDTHDLSDFWDQTETVNLNIEIETEKRYVALDRDISDKLRKAAKRQGVSTETFLNLWLKEKLGA